MPTCREVALAVAGEQLERASMARRMMVRLHLLMCSHCRRYAAQVRILGEAARELAASPSGESVERLRHAILRRLESSDAG